MTSVEKPVVCSKCGAGGDESVTQNNQQARSDSPSPEESPNEEVERSEEEAKPEKQTNREHKGRFAVIMADLRRKWGRRGIIEISSSHPRYQLTNCIRQGLQECFKNEDVSGNITAQTDLIEEDFTAVDVFHLTNDNNKKFEFRSYAPKMFSKLRRVINFSEEEYQSSLVPSSRLPYLELLSNSKSGMSFFLCNNKMFVIKTEKVKDVKFFRSILKTYLNHFERYPHTLMVKIFGLHSIHIKGHRTRFFTVMQSVFYPDDRIVERYDLKGCHADRYTEPELEDSHIIAILKDNNLENKKINLGPQKQWFIEQVKHDSNFLEEIGVMDYSLILGRQLIHSTERREEDKFADVVVRVQKSVPLKKFQAAANRSLCENCKKEMCGQGGKMSTAADVDGSDVADCGQAEGGDGSQIGPAESIDERQIAQGKLKQTNTSTSLSAVQVQNADGETDATTHKQKTETQHTVLPGQIPGTPQNEPTSHNDTSRNNSGLSKVDFDQVKYRNQRLLPLTPNALHVIDGENERYFVGIIDIFTQYKVKKKLEHVYKLFRFPCTSFSTVSPQKYSRRFRDFLDQHTT